MEGKKKGGSGLGIASLILGIVALVVSCGIYAISIPCAVISSVLGVMSIAGNRKGKNIAIAGVVCAVISLVLAVITIKTGGVMFDTWRAIISGNLET